MKIKIVHLLTIAWLLLVSGCNLAEVNEDHNRPAVVPTNAVFLSAQKQLIDNIRNDYVSLRGGVLFSQHFSQLGYTSESRYDISLSTSDKYWDNTYLALNNLNYIIEYNSDPATQNIALLGGGSNANQIALSRILKAYAFHSLTDVFGAVPYQSYGNKDPEFEALQQDPDNYTPVYAPQSKIYSDLLNELKAAADTLLKDPKGNTFGKFDVIYKGDNAKWAKLANSLRLRLATRIQEKLPALAQKHFDEALAGGVFESNQDNAVFTYSITAPNEAPLYRATVTANRKDFAVSNVLVDVLKGERGPFGADPRLAIYALPSTKIKEYLGMPYGLAQATASLFKADTVSLPGAVVNAANFGEVLIEYAEVAFLIAENKNWDDTYYRKGVQASLARWGVSTVDQNNYLATLAPANKEFVLTQKYLALYMQGIEAWSEIRRTGYPLFLIKKGDVIWIDSKGVSYTFEPLFGNGIPGRLRYPNKEQSVNRKNYQQALSIQGPDAIETNIWWASK